jgi:hypothetical protein
MEVMCHDSLLGAEYPFVGVSRTPRRAFYRNSPSTEEGKYHLSRVQYLLSGTDFRPLVRIANASGTSVATQLRARIAGPQSRHMSSLSTVVESRDSPGMSRKIAL